MNLNTKLVFERKNIGVGKHKESSARVFLFKGEGQLIINNIPGDKYLQCNISYLNSIWKPLEKLKLNKDFNIRAFVKGGGITGQTQAIQLGVAKLLLKINHNNRLVLKPFGLLTRDSRVKERKKYGLKKARKASQYSKR